MKKMGVPAILLCVMPGACMTYTGMCGSGAGTGTENILRRQ